MNLGLESYMSMHEQALEKRGDSSSLHQCSGCKRTFARADLLKRHKQRKAKLAQNPRPARQKSCNECATAKTKCDLQVPTCGSCKMKRRTCQYAVNSGNPNFRKARSAALAISNKIEKPPQKSHSMEIESTHLNNGHQSIPSSQLVTEQDTRWVDSGGGGHDWLALLESFQIPKVASPVPSCATSRSSFSVTDSLSDSYHTNSTDSEAQTSHSIIDPHAIVGQGTNLGELAPINTGYPISGGGSEDITPTQYQFNGLVPDVLASSMNPIASMPNHSTSVDIPSSGNPLTTTGFEETRTSVPMSLPQLNNLLGEINIPSNLCFESIFS